MRKILEALGLHALTNREALMEELAALDNETFFRMMAGNRVIAIMERHQCEDCRARFGECPSRDDVTPCRVSTEDWMDWECRCERLIPDTTTE